MSTYITNVVPITGSGRDRDPGQRIVRECRTRLTKSMADWLTAIGEEIAEDLFVLAGGTGNRIEQTRYLDLRNGVERRWPELVSAFQEAFLTKESQTGNVTVQIADFAGLELVDDVKLSENILVNEFSARLAETCNDELYGLDRRIAALLDIDDVDKLENPLGPAAICPALAESCTALVSDLGQRTVLLRRLEKHLHQSQPRIYQELNQYLVSLNVLPELKRTYRRNSSKSEAIDEAVVATPVPQPATKLPDGDVFNALQRLIAARTESSTAAQTGFPGSTESRSSGADTANSIAIDATALSRAFFASLEHFHVEGGDGMVNQINAIRSSEAVRQVGHVEAVTIDIVAMLFDFIFNDKDISNGVKALVGRLQIPVLKVAMLDQSFFANRSHPARRFLDEISGVSLRWGGEIDQSDPFYIILASLIERIQDEFECDVEVFGRALEELHAFVGNNEFEEAATTKVAAEMATRRECESSAWEQAHAAVDEAIKAATPHVIAEFLKEQWTEVLQRIAVNHSMESAQWHDAVKLMADLPQSVIPKKTPDERMALIGSLPTLLGRVNRGLDLVNDDKTERRPFFDALVEMHTAALKGEAAVANPPPAKPAPVANVIPQDPEGDLIITRSIANGVEVEEVTLVGAKPTWRADDREAARQVADLERGDWVEFRQDDGSASRERLTWISPRGHLLVFSNHQASKAISIAPDALAKKIRKGEAAVISDESLFERAMGGVLESLSAA
ncbi:MAG: DUF1631 family protein [Betaproteobacteria bacterium]